MSIRTEDLYREYMGSMLVKCSRHNTAKVLGDLFCTSFLTYERFKELVYRTDLEPKTSAFLNGVNAAINTIAENSNEALEVPGADINAVMATAGEAINSLSEFSEEILSSATESTVESIKGAVSLIIANEKLKFDEEKQEKIDNVSLLEDEDEDGEDGEDNDDKADESGDDESGKKEESSESEDWGDTEDSTEEPSEEESEESTDGGDGGNPFDEDETPSAAKESAELGNLAMYTEDNIVVEVERPVQYIGGRVKELILSSEETKSQLEAMPVEEAVSTAKIISDSMIEAIIVCAAFCTDMRIPVPHLSHIFENISGTMNDNY